MTQLSQAIARLEAWRVRKNRDVAPLEYVLSPDSFFADLALLLAAARAHSEQQAVEASDEDLNTVSRLGAALFEEYGSSKDRPRPFRAALSALGLAIVRSRT